jgi:hypothetical protein
MALSISSQTIPRHVGSALRTNRLPPMPHQARQGGWKRDAPSTVKSISESDPGVVPGDCFHRSTIYLSQALLNLDAPTLFSLDINICVNAFNQGIDQSHACFGWQGQRIFK